MANPREKKQGTKVMRKIPTGKLPGIQLEHMSHQVKKCLNPKGPIETYKGKRLLAQKRLISLLYISKTVFPKHVKITISMKLYLFRKLIVSLMAISVALFMGKP